MYISPEHFDNLPPEKQVNLMKEYIKDLSLEERKILKYMLDNKITASDDTGAV